MRCVQHRVLSILEHAFQQDSCLAQLAHLGSLLHLRSCIFRFLHDLASLFHRSNSLCGCIRLGFLCIVCRSIRDLSDIVLSVSELAPGAIRAVELLMEPSAQLGLVVLGHVGLGVQFLLAVGEAAARFEGALTCELEVFTQFSFVFRPEVNGSSFFIVGLVIQGVVQILNTSLNLRVIVLIDEIRDALVVTWLSGNFLLLHGIF
jgi:hypothetical protein